MRIFKVKNISTILFVIFITSFLLPVPLEVHGYNAIADALNALSLSTFLIPAAIAALGIIYLGIDKMVRTLFSFILKPFKSIMRLSIINL
jgi:hypothetical protein